MQFSASSQKWACCSSLLFFCGGLASFSRRTFCAELLHRSRPSVSLAKCVKQFAMCVMSNWVLLEGDFAPLLVLWRGLTTQWILSYRSPLAWVAARPRQLEFVFSIIALSASVLTFRSML